MLQINKIAEVSQAEVIAYPSQKDHFASPFLQHVLLPGTFLPGDHFTLTHTCIKCQHPISFTTEYGSFIAGKTWTLKRLANQRDLLDQVGQLLNLTLEQPKENGVEIARYYTAVLDIAMVGYYRCPHCASQYLTGYARHGTDSEGRGIPESDTMHIQSIAMIEINEQEFLNALRMTVPIVL